MCVFFFQAEDGIRDLVRSRGLGDVYKRQEVVSEAEVVVDVELQRGRGRGPTTRSAIGFSFVLSLIHI